MDTQQIIIESMTCWQEAGFETLPKGWTNKSVKKAGRTIAKDVGLNDPTDKNFFDKCVEKMIGKIDNPEGYCAAMKDEAYGGDKASTFWRGKGKTKSKVLSQMRQIRKK